MGTVNVTLGDATQLNLILGQQNENEVTEVVFNFAAWKTAYGSGTLALSVQRPGDQQPYAVVMTTSGDTATWEVSSLDTAYNGTGEIQLTYTVGTLVKKSVVYMFTVYGSIGANGEYPSPGQTWQEEIEDEIADVKQDLDTVNLGNYFFSTVANKYIVRETGNEASYSGWSASDYIPCPPYSLLFIDTNGESLNYGAMYDENKTYVEARGWGTLLPRYYNNTNNFVYFRLSGSNENMANVRVTIFQQTDKTLAIEGMPADAKKTGDEALGVKPNIAVIENRLGAKNLIKSKQYSASPASVTIVSNNDGIYVLNGTTSSTLYADIQTVELVENEQYTLNGGQAGTNLQVLNEAKNTVVAVINGTGETSFTAPYTGTYYIRLNTVKNKVYNNDEFKPMIRYKDIIDSTFVKYSPSNAELGKSVEDINANIDQLNVIGTFVTNGAIYPFTADSTLYRPNYPSQIVYSMEQNGIIDLVVYADDNADYYVSVLYSYHASEHTSVLRIKNNNGRTGTYVSPQRASDTNLPTETFDIYDDNNVLMARATVDWSKINKANGIGLDIGSTKILESCIMRTSGIIRFLPLTDVYITNVQQRIYFNELCRGANDGYFVVSVTGATYPEVTYSDRYVQFNVTSTKNITVTISFKREGIIVASKTITVHCNISALPSKKYLFLGDSYTASGYIQKWFYDNNTGKVTLYGTQGTSPYLHEGRNGWSVNDYFSASKGGVTNPFYNPTSQTFDFSYYMSNNPSFNDVEIVNILLGRNNGFSTSIMTRMQQIIDSIKNYNSSIIVTVMVGSNVAFDNSGCGKYLQNNNDFDLACFHYNEVVNYTDANMVYQNLNLDNIYDFARAEVQATYNNPAVVTVYTDNVHPSQYGYEAFGIAYNGFMHNLLNA